MFFLERAEEETAAPCGADEKDGMQADRDIQLSNIYLRGAMCSSSIWATAETRREQEAPLGAAGATFSRSPPSPPSLFSFYWGEIFNIVFHSSPRNEYFCSLEFMGNAVNRLEICACGTKNSAENVKN